MCLFRKFNRGLLLPISDVLLDTSIAKKLSFLEKSQWWSSSELENFQNENFRNLIQYAYKYIPFYYSKLRELKLKPVNFLTLNDILKIPVVTKEIIKREGYDKFVSSEYPGNKRFSVFSSGSTGQPFQYYLTRDSYSIKYAAAIRGWQWMGFTMGDCYAKLSQNRRKGWKKKLQDKVNRSLYYYIPDLKPSSLLAIIHQLDKDRPLFIRCYPDPLFFMARIMQRNNIRFNWVKAINTTGNTLYNEARSLIEQQFGCKVYDSYSCEGSALFFQVDGYPGYLGSRETAITEVLDQQNNPVSQGMTGRHVTTELWNLAMPFIRYDTLDLVEMDVQGKKAGRNLMAINKIIGRESDILVAPDGNLLIVHLFTIYFEYFNCIQQFQVEQTDFFSFIFRLVVTRDFTKTIEKQIRDYWINFLGSMVNLTIEIHDEIPVLYSGKRRFLIRNKDIPLP